MSSDEVIVVLCTCPQGSVPAAISRTLVEEGLAACVNIVNQVQSIYRWDDQIQDDEEALLIIKTARSRYPQLEARLEKLHPFEIPEILALPVKGGLQKYLDWVVSDGK